MLLSYFIVISLSLISLPECFSSYVVVLKLSGKDKFSSAHIIRNANVFSESDNLIEIDLSGGFSYQKLNFNEILESSHLMLGKSDITVDVSTWKEHSIPGEEYATYTDGIDNSYPTTRILTISLAELGLEADGQSSAVGRDEGCNEEKIVSSFNGEIIMEGMTGITSSENLMGPFLWASLIPPLT